MTRLTQLQFRPAIHGGKLKQQWEHSIDGWFQLDQIRVSQQMRLRLFKKGEVKPDVDQAEDAPKTDVDTNKVADAVLTEED